MVALYPCYVCGRIYGSGDITSTVLSVGSNLMDLDNGLWKLLFFHFSIFTAYKNDMIISYNDVAV
jgi:hypothetical protein